MGSSGEESDQEVLYHQLATEEKEEGVEEERRRIFRPRIYHNSIMELSIHNRRLFFICLAVIEAFGISAVILTVHWAINIKGGVTYVENMGIPFNWHPILMTISLIFLYGNGALIYRIIPPKNEGHKLRLKLAHAGIMIVAFALMVIGLQLSTVTTSPTLQSPTCTHYTAGWVSSPPCFLAASGLSASLLSFSQNSPQRSEPSSFPFTSILAPPSLPWLWQLPAWDTWRR